MLFYVAGYLEDYEGPDGQTQDVNIVLDDIDVDCAKDKARKHFLENKVNVHIYYVAPIVLDENGIWDGAKEHP